jgi:MerR, DNA binding
LPKATTSASIRSDIKSGSASCQRPHGRAGDTGSTRPQVNRVNLVRHALRFGFSRLEIAGFLRVRASGGTPCRAIRAAADRILAVVDQRIAELTTLQKEIKHTLREWDRRLARTLPNRPARLLLSLEVSALHLASSEDRPAQPDVPAVSACPGECGCGRPTAA